MNGKTDFVSRGQHNRWGRYRLPEQEWDLNHQMGHSFPYVINAVMSSRYPEWGLKFTNRGLRAMG